MTDNNNVSRETMTALPVMVYGSLRPEGNGARGAMAMASIAGPWQAVTTGDLCYHECGAYPVMDCNGDGIVVGDMYLVDEAHPDWAWLVKMETEAGYEMRWHDVLAKQSDGEWKTTKAIVFDWPHGTTGLERVENGDWVTADWRPWPKMKVGKR
jgi:gamma-glutamylcyclotransferase (GGCT)/AIG2-like uncharacterized protein YtfP